MRYIKTFEFYSQIDNLYDQMNDLLALAEQICDCELSNATEAMDELREIETPEAMTLYNEIDILDSKISDDNVFEEDDDINIHPQDDID